MFNVHNAVRSCVPPQRRCCGRACSLPQVFLSNLGVYVIRSRPVDNEVTRPRLRFSPVEQRLKFRFARTCKRLMKLSGFRKRQSPSRSSVLTGFWSNVFTQTCFQLDRPPNLKPRCASDRSMQHTEFCQILKNDQPTTRK
jgi:hypothetical protein